VHKALGPILAAILSLAVIGVAQAADDNFRVTLLGTGSPDPDPNRFSASTLIEAGSQKLLIDVGRGATIRLYQLHVPLSQIDVVFFTHYHSDHTIGLPDLLLTGWLPPSYAHRTTPLHVIGPVGAKNLLSNLAVAYDADIKGREEDQHLPPRSVLVSGDTRFNENVIKHGEGVDLLIHEVFVASQELLKLPAFQKILTIHTTPNQAGTVFARTHPKLAAYTHIAALGTPTAPAPSIADIVTETRQTYQGPLIVGADLMAFDIGVGGVTVYRAAP
jgi:ribonuclease Z